MHERVKAIFFRLDVRDEGFLGRAEVEKLLGEMQMEMIQDDAPPTELAVNWVMRVADSGGNGKLDVNDCEKAIKLYAHYLRTKDQVDRIFATYDGGTAAARQSRRDEVGQVRRTQQRRRSHERGVGLDHRQV